jgi:DHA3 family multidrug efflux protein-like MFS transporter
MPFMSEGGTGADLIGDWFGAGPDRAIALVFTITGIFGFIVTLLAFNSRQYRTLSEQYLKPTTDTEKKAAP